MQENRNLDFMATYCTLNEIAFLGDMWLSGFAALSSEDKKEGIQEGTTEGDCEEK